MPDLQPIMSDRELFADGLYPSTTDLFSTIDPAQLHTEEEVEFGPYFQYLLSESASLPPHEILGPISHSCLHDNLLYRSYITGRFRKRHQYGDQLVIPHRLKGLVLHVCHDYVSSGGYFSFKST